MDDLMYAMQLLRPLWLPSLVLSLAAAAGLALIAWADPAIGRENHRRMITGNAP